MPKLKLFDMVELFFDENLRYVACDEAGPSSDDEIYYINGDQV